MVGSLGEGRDTGCGRGGAAGLRYIETDMRGSWKADQERDISYQHINISTDITTNLTSTTGYEMREPTGEVDASYYACKKTRHVDVEVVVGYDCGVAVGVFFFCASPRSTEEVTKG